MSEAYGRESAGGGVSSDFSSAKINAGLAGSESLASLSLQRPQFPIDLE